jgi:hypothetical protein
VIKIEVLSEDPYEGTTLEEVAYDITDGHCSGELSDEVRNQEVTGPEMVKLLNAQGSDPGFMLLSDDGDDLSDEGC